MNTLNSGYPPILKPGEYVFLLEDLELAMTPKQLESITNLHNKGMDFQAISKEVKRNPYEVIVALLHQVKAGRKMRPFAYRGEMN